MGDSRITREEVEHVARLARLALDDRELETMRAQLDAILAFMNELDAVDVADVPPTAHAIPMEAPLREDVARPGLAHGEALAAAPEPEAGGFAVPRVLEGDS